MSGIGDQYYGGGPYDRWEVEANAAEWELYIASSDEMRDRADKEATAAREGLQSPMLYEEMQEGRKLAGVYAVEELGG